LSLLLFLTVLSSLVLAHEWGHYFVAKRLGITVHRFSIGFGPVLLRKTLGGTEFCVSLVPLGGYVKLAGEEAKDATGGPGDFSLRPAWQRFAVVFAGPLVNALLAFAIFTGVYMAGNPVPAALVGVPVPSVVGRVSEGYPAAKSGIRAGDRIVAIDGAEVRLWSDILRALRSADGQPMRFEILRAEQRISAEVSPPVEESRGLFGKKRKVGLIGIASIEDTSNIKAGFFDSFKYGAKHVYYLTDLILDSLGKLFTGQSSFKDSMTGPIGIYFLTDQAAKFGILVLLNFAASLSVSLFVLNLLPVPVLDGGHLFYIIVESIIRRPVPEKIKELSMQVGLYLLLAVAGLVIWQDIVKYGIFDKIRVAIGL